MPTAAKLYYFSHGERETENPPIVLIHGAGGTHLFWPAELRRLPGYRVFAIDLPGHGKSAGHVEQSVVAYAGAVVAWLEEIRLPQAVFVGHSMGSAIVQVMALEHPEHVLGLVLAGAGARLRVHPDLLQASAHESTFLTAVEIVVSSAFSPRTPPPLIEVAGKRMAGTRPSVLHGDFQACDSFDATGRLSEIYQPTLVIYGEDDRLTPPRYAQYLANRIASATLEMIPDAGHMVMLEQPQRFTASLRAFLQQFGS